MTQRAMDEILHSNVGHFPVNIFEVGRLGVLGFAGLFRNQLNKLLNIQPYETI